MPRKVMKEWGWPLRAVLITIAWTAALLVAAAPACAQPQPGAAVVVDGPSAAITSPVDLRLSISRDGTGGLVYLKQVAGTQHVFVSALTGGTFASPVQVDTGLGGGSSQPVIAAANGGILLVAFVNNGSLYVEQRTSSATGFTGPQLLAIGGSNPSLQASMFGKGYLAFTIGAGYGSDVRAAYYYSGAWALESSPLNAISAGDGAGSGTLRPAVAAAGDGVGIVAWGEGGHIYTRRVWATSPSVVTEQADEPVPGCNQVSADEPAIGSQGDSSYATVAFHAVLSCSGVSQSRVFANRLRASRYAGMYAADGLTNQSDGADRPVVAVAEYGLGWVSSERIGAGDVFAFSLDSNEAPFSVTQVNSLSDASDPYATAAVAGLKSSLIVWQHDPGVSGVPEIRARTATKGVFDSDLALSSGAQGSADAADGLTAAGEGGGESAVAWIQSTLSGDEVMVDQLYQPPGTPDAQDPPGYVRSARPLLLWTAPKTAWGPLRYQVSVDGQAIGQTSATSFVPVTPLAQGPHTWQVNALNPAGQIGGASSGTLFVDSVPPVVKVTLKGTVRVGSSLQLRAGSWLQLHAIYTDDPSPLPAADSSGIAAAEVRWGEGSTETFKHYRSHTFKRTGRYTIVVLVSDHAGNLTRMNIPIVVVTKTSPAPKTKTKTKGKGNTKSKSKSKLKPKPAYSSTGKPRQAKVVS